MWVYLVSFKSICSNITLFHSTNYKLSIFNSRCWAVDKWMTPKRCLVGWKQDIYQTFIQGWAIKLAQFSITIHFWSILLIVYSRISSGSHSRSKSNSSLSLCRLLVGYTTSSSQRKKLHIHQQPGFSQDAPATGSIGKNYIAWQRLIKIKNRSISPSHTFITE